MSWTKRLSASALALLAAGAVASARPARETHVIQLTGNRFSPADLTVKAGDSLRFVNGRGGLHNVAFREDALTPAVRRILDAAMPGREEFTVFPEPPLASPMMVAEGEVYAFTIPALPPGKYEYFCAPHFGAGMKGTITVVP